MIEYSQYDKKNMDNMIIKHSQHDDTIFTT